MRAALLAVFAACYQPSPPAGAPCSNDAPCPAGQSCSPQQVCVFGDAGAVAGDACGVPDHCDGDTLVSCTGSQACDHGCGGDHCLELAPSNGLTTALLTDATADVGFSKLEFDTVSGRIKSANTTIRAAGEGVIADIGFTVIDGMGVFSAHAFVLPEGDSWTVTGSNALVLYAATAIAIHGSIDVGASGGTGGPAGNNGGSSTNNPPCRGKAGLAGALGFGEGGGGGGGATAGGNGAPSSGATFGGGGSMCTVPSTIPLRGGNGGGAGGVDPATNAVRGGRGGGSGGAIALVAMDAILIEGVIAAPGGGGFSASTGDGGGGGGGGGAVFLESPVIIVDGALTANGGGGAGPSASTGSRGHVNDANTASGGTFAGVTGGRGGAGMTPPTNGQNATDTTLSSRGGGGGGSVGRIELRSLGATVSPMAVESPPATRSTAIVQ